MDPLFIGIAILTSVLIIYYFWFCGLNCFKNAGIIHKRPVPLFGNISRGVLQKVVLADIITESYNINPDAKYIGFFEMMTPIIMIRDVELIKQILVKNFESFPKHIGYINPENEPIFGRNLFSLYGDTWRQARILLSPVFTATKLKCMFELMSDCSTSVAEFLAELPSGKTAVEFRNVCRRYANDVIATCAFGINVDSMRNPENEFWMAGQRLTNKSLLQSVMLSFVRSYPRISRHLGFKFIPDREAVFIKNLMESTVRTREEKGIYRPDLVQLMMETRQKGTDKGLSMDEMIAHAFIFFFAGFDTVSITMTFATYFIATNPRVYKKLQDEVDRVNESCNGKPTYEAIAEMAYLEAVIHETLRLHPPSEFMHRECMKECELPPALPGAKPYLVRKGDIIWCPACAIHRDPKYFDDPDTFNPERFLVDDGKLAKSAAFFPFGNGPRQCIGLRFAMLEVKLFIFHLLTKCQIETCAKTPNPLVLSGLSFSLKIEGGMWLDVKAREINDKSTLVNVSNGSTHMKCQ